MANVEISTSSVPVGFCFVDFATSWPFLVSLLSGEADVSPNVHIGDAPPTDLTKVWAKTISGVPDRLYGFQSGVWLARHPIPTGFTLLAPAGHNPASIESLDGGEAGAVTAYTGPMWEIDIDFSALFPIGPGTLASGAIISEGDAGGAEEVSLTIAQMPPHDHPVLAANSNTEGGSTVQRLRPDSVLANSDANTGLTGGDPVTGLVAPHPNMPPYRVRYFLRKSARTHYRG